MTNSIFLNPTTIIDSDHPRVQDLADTLTKSVGTSQIEQAKALFYWVRDEIRYDPYTAFYRPEHFRASDVIERGRGFCIPKASLLCALGRACGIPSRVGFATVRNHLATRELIDMLGCDLFSWHGFVEFYLNEQWFKATPTFNIELCRKFNVRPLDFNGQEDSIFHEYSQDKKKFMEYVEFLGVYADIPVNKIVAGWKVTYGEKRVMQWIDELEKTGGRTWRQFMDEEPVG